MTPQPRTRVESGWTRSRFGFWDDLCPPQNKVQRGGHDVRQAIGALCDAQFETPNEAWDTLKDLGRKAHELLRQIEVRLKDLDKQWCERCGGRWTDDPYHIAYCETAKYPEDDYDAVRDALRSDVVYGGAPLAQRREEVA